MKKIKEGQKIYFLGEDLPFKVIIADENFAICTRDLCKKYDSELLEHEVEMDAYSSIEEAYHNTKNEMVYSIIDFKNNVRGPHDFVFNPYDFKDINSIKELLSDLISGKADISGRNMCDLNIDWNKT